MSFSSRRPKPAVSAVVINPDRKVLLTLRSEKVLWPGFWCLPGGHLDGGQDWLGACAAELQEEAGLVLEEAKLVGIYSDPALNTLRDPLKNEDHCFVVASFLITRYQGQVECNDEVEKWGWFALSELPTPLLAPEKIKIQDAFEFQGRVFVR